jgi:hypothetical protein
MKQCRAQQCACACLKKGPAAQCPDRLTRWREDRLLVAADIHGDQRLLVGILIFRVFPRSTKNGELHLLSQEASETDSEAAGNAALVSRVASSMGRLFDFGSDSYYGLPGAPFIFTLC